MENGGNYGEARSSQENKNLLKKIDDSLKDDQKIDNTEAKEIQNEYKKLKSNIVAITKEELASFAKGLGLEESASLGKTLNKLRKKSNEEVIAVTPEETENSEIQAVHPETTEPTVVESNINQAEIISYFDIKNTETLTKGLEESGLNLFKMLNGYKDYIENDLKGLDPTILNKIKQSILIKTGLINGVIEELREDNKDSDITFKNNRWILNEQITDIFEQINTEILPSAFFLLKYNESGDKSKFLDDSIKGVYKKQHRGSHGVKNNNKINLKFEEIQEMFASNLDDEGNFDEGLFSTQDVLGTGDINEANILKNIGFDDSGISEISLLSEADKKIEADIMIKYMAFVFFMMIPYAGATVSIPSDIIDLFSSTEGTITTMKALGFVQDDYEMSKSLVDNVFGAIGIVGSIFGIQAIAKGKKLVKVTSKLNKLGVSSSDIAIRVKEETKILKAKFGNGDDIINKASGTGIQRIVEDPIIKGNKLEIKLGNGERIKLFEKVFSVEKKGEDYILKNGDNLYIIKKGSESNIGPYKYKLVGNKLIIKNEIKTIHGLTDQSKISKVEQLPVLKVKQVPISIKNVEGISDIKNPELIQEFSEKIYEPLLDIKNSSKIAEAEIIESKIVENISKLDNILDNIDNLKQSFKLKGEKISDLFSKTLEGIKNYILGLKKSLKIKLVKTPKIKGKIGEILLIDGGQIKIGDKILQVRKHGDNFILKDNNNVDYIIREGKFDNTILGYKVKVDGEKIVFEKLLSKSEKILSKSEKLLQNFDNLPKSEHAKELLNKYPNLKPVDTFQKDNQTFFLSKIYKYGDYDEVVGFIEVDGKMETRLFYKSNSDGGWRATPGERIDGGYSKGESIDGHSYTITTKLNEEIGKRLDSLDIIESNESLIKEFKGGKIAGTKYLDPYGKHSDSISSETFLFNDKGELNNFRKKGKPGELRDDFKGQSINSILKYFKNLKYPNGFLPNFTNGPKSSYIINHKIVGETNIDVFEGILNGKKVEWHIARNIKNPEQIWISNIRLSGGKINSFGIDKTFIDSGVLNTKPFEYSTQLPNSLKDNLSEIKVPNLEKYYIDITPILAELKPIREYKQYLAAKQLKKAA